MLNEYGPLGAEFYDLTKPVDGEYPDVAYYLRQLKKIRGPILEVAVGTGRLLVPLLSAGLKVQGLDSSDIMLKYCDKHCRARKLKPKLLRGRMEALNLNERFAAIIVCFGSFQILEDRAAVEGALDGFLRHLEPGGKLFIDLDVPHIDTARAGLKSHGVTIDAEDGSQIVLEGSRGYDWVEQIESVHLRYERWKGGALVSSELQRLPLRWYSHYEFASLLRERGFQNVQVFADFEEGLVPGPGTQSLCFTAQKKL